MLLLVSCILTRSTSSPRYSETRKKYPMILHTKWSIKIFFDILYFRFEPMGFLKCVLKTWLSFSNLTWCHTLSLYFYSKENKQFCTRFKLVLLFALAAWQASDGRWILAGVVWSLGWATSRNGSRESGEESLKCTGGRRIYQLLHVSW